MTKENKTQSELILDALMTRQILSLNEITLMVIEAAGKKLSVQAIASLMSKLSDSRKSTIGYFISKTKIPTGYVYSLVPEIMNLSSDEIYDLTRKTGKNRFTLEKALEKVSGLEKYVKKPAKPVKKKSAVKKTLKKKILIEKARAKRGKPKAVKKQSIQSSEPETIEIPVVQKAGFKEFVADFLSEMNRMGGLRVNICWNVRVTK